MIEALEEAKSLLWAELTFFFSLTNVPAQTSGQRLGHGRDLWPLLTLSASTPFGCHIQEKLYSSPRPGSEAGLVVTGDNPWKEPRSPQLLLYQIFPLSAIGPVQSSGRGQLYLAEKVQDIFLFLLLIPAA